MAASPPVILSTLPLSPEARRRVANAAPGYRLVCKPVGSYTETDRALDDSVEILFTNYAPTTLEPAPRLKWVQLASVGINHLANSPLLASERVLLTNARGTMSGPLAEFTLGAMLSLARNFPQAFRLQESRKWIHNNDRLEHFPAVELRGKTLGLLGYGSVAQEVARLARAFGMRIVALATGSLPTRRTREKRYVPPALRRHRLPKPDVLYSGLACLPELLRESDFLVNTLPLTPLTRHLMGSKELRMLRREAFLVNISRGHIIDEGALREVLEKGQIAGALLDVFDEEPLGPDNPLYTTPGLVITPHISGVFAGMVDAMVELFCENLELFFAGKPLYNPVGRQRGY